MTPLRAKRQTTYPAPVSIRGEQARAVTALQNTKFVAALHTVGQKFSQLNKPAAAAAAGNMDVKALTPMALPATNWPAITFGILEVGVSSIPP